MYKRQLADRSVVLLEEALELLVGLDDAARLLERVDLCVEEQARSGRLEVLVEGDERGRDGPCDRTAANSLSEQPSRKTSSEFGGALRSERMRRLRRYCERRRRSVPAVGEEEERRGGRTVAISHVSTMTSFLRARPSGFSCGGSTRPWIEIRSSYLTAASCIDAVMTATDGRSGSCERSMPKMTGACDSIHPPSVPS